MKSQFEIVVTPLAPHSLAFRPFLLSSDAALTIEVLRANEGTTYGSLAADSGSESAKGCCFRQQGWHTWPKSISRSRTHPANGWLDGVSHPAPGSGRVFSPFQNLAPTSI